MNIKITSKNGVTLNTANKYVKEDIAITIDESLLGSGGTAVPSSGYIEKVYFNTAKSNEEILEVAKTLNYISLEPFNFSGFDGHIIYTSQDLSFVLAFIHNLSSDTYFISLLKNGAYDGDLWSMSSGFIVDEVSIGGDNYLSTLAPQYNQEIQTELYSSFISVTPFSSGSCEGLIEVASFDDLPIPSTNVKDIMLISGGEGGLLKTTIPYKILFITVDDVPTSNIKTTTEAGVYCYYIKNENDIFIYDGDWIRMIELLSMITDNDLTALTFNGEYNETTSTDDGYYVVMGSDEVKENTIYKYNISGCDLYIYEDGSWVNYSEMFRNYGMTMNIYIVETIPDVSQMELTSEATMTFNCYYVNGDEVGYVTMDGSTLLTTTDMDLPPLKGVVLSTDGMTDTNYGYLINNSTDYYYTYDEYWKQLIADPVIPSGILEITSNGSHDVSQYETASVHIQTSKPEQSKTVTPTKSTQYVTPNSGYTLSKVTVNPIPSNYITPSGTFNITTNGSYDISLYRYAAVKVPKPSGVKTITANGTHDVTNYETVNVVVSPTTTPYLNTSNIVNMSQLFMACSNLETITPLDTSSATNMSQTFYGCEKLTEVYLSDTSNVTKMNSMFYNCRNLTKVPQIDTSNVTNMQSMFYDCSKITDASELDMSSATQISYMFSGCTNLISAPSFSTKKLGFMNSMFSGCIKLQTIDITYYAIYSHTNAAAFAARCTALKSLIIREFGSDYVLDVEALKNSGIANGTGYIYVPRNMVDTLKSATNWSTYADQIRALEDYTVDGTTSGELDESKI